MVLSFKLLSIITLLSVLFLGSGCQKEVDSDQPPGSVPDSARGFTKTPAKTELSGTEITEASGIADSKANPGFLWVEEDSGNPADLILLGHDGSVGKTIPVSGAQNRDWEDLVLSAGPESGKSYLYIGDIGDNNSEYTSYDIYRMEEPQQAASIVASFDKLSFLYPDVSHDAEAFLVDPASLDIFIITKQDDNSKIYRLAYPQATSGNNMAEFIADLPYNGVVSAAQSPDNKEIIIKTYTKLYYYKREEGMSIPEALRSEAKELDYTLEAQGEALSFAADNSGFYTLPEQALGVQPALSFYKRN